MYDLYDETWLSYKVCGPDAYPVMAKKLFNCALAELREYAGFDTGKAMEMITGAENEMLSAAVKAPKDIDMTEWCFSVNNAGSEAVLVLTPYTAVVRYPDRTARYELADEREAWTPGEMPEEPSGRYALYIFHDGRTDMLESGDYHDMLQTLSDKVIDTLSYEGKVMAAAKWFKAITDPDPDGDVAWDEDKRVAVILPDTRIFLKEERYV